MAALDPKGWLRVMVGAMPGEPTPRRMTRLAVFAARLGVEFRRSAFTPDTARACGRRFVETPDYDTLAAALRHAQPEQPVAEDQPADAAMGALWDRYVERRLGEGGDRAHLLSLVRTYAPRAGLRPILARHFAPELAEIIAHEAEVVRDKALLADSVARLTRATAPPAVPTPAAATPEPAPPAGPIARPISGSHLEAARAKAAATRGLPRAPAKPQEPGP
tara:strand:- start:3605 stop:4264 length:660 start_codon:yes stop_codon:yes gene_type:complete